MGRLSSADGVVVVGTSQDPMACVQRDRDALIEAFQSHVYLGPPDWSLRFVFYLFICVKVAFWNELFATIQHTLLTRQEVCPSRVQGRLEREHSAFACVGNGGSDHGSAAVLG